MVDNLAHVKGIAETLEKIASGDYLVCEHCGNVTENTEHCEECGEEIEDAYSAGMWGYFNDVYDIEYSIGGDKSFRGVRLMVAFGGPNIYVNTNNGMIELFWWGDRANYPISSTVCDEINDIFEEYYACL